jgi:protein involved in sex pheromone biosynthesis
MHKNRIIALALALCLCGCSISNSSQTTTSDSDDYSAVLPFESSDTRSKHVGLISDTDLRIEAEDGLMQLSKQYFSVDSVSYKTHQYLDYDELDATDGSRGLLGTQRDGNPNGLNPSSDEEFDTGNGTVTGATILVDIYELDWYSNDKIKGVSLGLIVNKEVTGSDGNDVEITDEKMKSYLEVTFSKLVSYMHDRFNDITNKVPIYVAAYQLDDSNDTGKGGYIYEGYYKGNEGTITSLTQEWVLVPSTRFTELDSDASSQLTEFKEDISKILPDNTYVTGQAKFESKKMKKLNLTITAHGKTAAEILAVIQQAKEKMSVFTSEKCDYLIQVLNDDTVYALIERKSGTTECTVISYL